MAITVAVDPTYESIVGKTLSTQAELLSKLKVAIVNVTLSAESYTTGGETLDLSLDGRLDTILACEVLEVSTGNVGQYVPAAGGAAATGKLKLYESGTASAPLDEVDAAESVTLTCKLRVYGFNSGN